MHPIRTRKPPGRQSVYYHCGCTQCPVSAEDGASRLPYAMELVNLCDLLHGTSSGGFKNLAVLAFALLLELRLEQKCNDAALAEINVCFRLVAMYAVKFAN